MIKYKRLKITPPSSGGEHVEAILSGMAGKNRVIVSITTKPLDKMILRVYRDADQIVDINSLHLVSAAPWLPMDLPLAEGSECKIGFYNDGAVTTDKHITIGYTESE